MNYAYRLENIKEKEKDKSFKIKKLKYILQIEENALIDILSKKV
jgi:hypothetical protein